MGLLETVTSYPTVLFTGLLGLLMVYWTFVGLSTVLGLTDHDHNGIPDFLEHALHLDKVFELLGLTAVPVVLAGSLAVLFGWFVSCLGTMALGPLSVGKGALVALGTLVGMLLPSAWLARKLAPRSEEFVGTRRRSLIGKVARVHSSTLNLEGGMVELRDGAKLLLEARLGEQHAPLQLTEGSDVLLFDYDESKAQFVVAPVKKRARMGS